MCVLCLLPDFLVATRQEQRIGIANLGLDEAEVARSIEQTGLPAFPVRQSCLDFVPKSHGRNVTERPGHDNEKS